MIRRLSIGRLPPPPGRNVWAERGAIRAERTHALSPRATYRTADSRHGAKSHHLVAGRTCR